MIDLQNARAISTAATQPGPWTVVTDDHGRCVVVDANGLWVADVGEAPGDAAFIAASRTLVPQLVAEVETLRAALREACEIGMHVIYSQHASVQTEGDLWRLRVLAKLAEGTP